MAGLSLGLNSLISQYSDDTKSYITAQHMMTVGDAANRYIKNNYSALTAIATPTTPALIRVSDLQSGGYVSTGFSITNPRRQDTCVLVLQPTPNNLNAIVVTENGETIDDLTLGQIAASIGGAGGAIYSTANTTIRGTMGSYNLPVGNYANANHLATHCDGTTSGAVSLTAGHPMMTLWYSDGNNASSTLYRDSVPGNPSLNTMNTPIIMGAGSVQTVDGACTVVGSLGRSNLGKVLMCDGSQWKEQGSASAYWKDPVLNLASLPSCNASSAFNVRLVTTPTVGAGQRAYSCNGAGVWQPLGVDDNGNMTIAGVASVGSIQLNTIAVKGDACASNGLQAREATGSPLSCVSGIWVAAGSASPAGMVAYFNSGTCPSGWVPANGTSGTVDLRGEFIRGLDSGRGVDAGRALGTAQNDAFETHEHFVVSSSVRNNNLAATNWMSGFYNPSNSDNFKPNLSGVNSPANIGRSSATGDTETRPRNVALLPCQAQ